MMLTMTDNAAEAVRLISAGSGLEPDPGLRISAGSPTPEGTPLEIGIAAEPAPTDETVEEGGARIYLEQDVVPALDDKVLDAAIEGDQVRFALRDVEAGSADGNGPGV
jgi:iron-sulfur cluster assembly protein